jgi:N-acetylglutamate synthase-like GNAT family acetyltransferase
MTIRIAEYDPVYQQAIDRMMETIQAEYDEVITTKHSIKINEAFKLPGQKYWVALCGEELAGTIGVILHSSDFAVVKRMMVAQPYRGSQGAAGMLFETGITWARSNGARHIYLGTMTQFKAAQKFYVKNGFREIDPATLPPDIKVNPMDSVHYRLDL